MTIYFRGCSGIETESGDVCKKAGSCSTLHVYDWLSDIKYLPSRHNIVEVRFKNTRKGFYRNINQLPLEQGDIVAVESSPGHDIGIVSLCGELVLEQMRKYNVDPESNSVKKVYRKAKPADIEKWKESILMEVPTMLKARKITESLKLDMKIGDVEYQGDNTKAIFYYIAEERVDFRELIKVLADEFQIRIEMRQVGARQEAGRIGGIGACGRQLCCSMWLTNFTSVTTHSARVQDISLNPQKLAGQCSKLKCCINYEVETYNHAKKDLPDIDRILETEAGNYYFHKADILKKVIWYSDSPDSSLNLTTLSIERASEIVELNKKGKKPVKLIEEGSLSTRDVAESVDFVANDSITRFDEKEIPAKKKKSKKRKKKRKFKGRDNDNQST